MYFSSLFSLLTVQVCPRWMWATLLFYRNVTYHTGHLVVLPIEYELLSYPWYNLCWCNGKNLKEASIRIFWHATFKVHGCSPLRCNLVQSFGMSMGIQLHSSWIHLFVYHSSVVSMPVIFPVAQLSLMLLFFCSSYSGSQKHVCIPMKLLCDPFLGTWFLFICAILEWINMPCSSPM